MSTFRNPVGPQPSKVYWRRRIVVGLGLLAAIVVVVLIVFRPGSGSADDKNTPDPSASASSSSTPGPHTAACTAADIALTAVTDKVRYAEDEKPMISMSITNTGSEDCTINAGSTQQVLQITSGSDVIWTSTDCQTGAVDAVITLEAGQTQSTTPIPWDRTRSSPKTCESERPAVKAGGASYHLGVTLGDFESEKTKQFILN